ncbi:MAG: hypothetical protein A2293_06770, partial [Elusimicrobia bacterium RIFOXYB2_FULL_49_7]
ISFPVNEVVSGLREEAFRKKGIREPYLSLARYVTGALAGGTLADEAITAYGNLLEQLQRKTDKAVSLRACLEDIRNDAAGSAARLKNNHPDFYRQLMAYVHNYRVTENFALGLTDPLPLRDVTARLLKDFAENRKISVSQPMPEEYFPEDTDFNRVIRLAALSGKLKQDSHHLKFRSQWKFMETLQPFGEFLIKKGEIKELGELFEHQPEWLLEKIEKYGKAYQQAVPAQGNGFVMEPYHVTFPDRMNDKEGTWEEVKSMLNEQGEDPVIISNLTEGYEKALPVLLNRYPERKSEFAKMRVRITDSKTATPAQRQGLVVLDRVTLGNSDRVAQELLRCVDRQAVNPEANDEKAAEELFLDAEEIIFFMSLDTERKIDYLKTMLAEAGRKAFAQALMHAIESQKEFDGIAKRLAQEGRLTRDELRDIRKTYARRDKKAGPFGLVVKYALEHDPALMRLAKDGRVEELSQLGARNIEYLRVLWEARTPGNPSNEFYRSLLAESAATGVSLSLVVLGVININRADHPADRVLLKRRYQTSFENTPVDYVYIGGGGQIACRIGRSVRWVTEHSPQSTQREPGHYCVSIVTPFDNGGSSQKDADAVRSKYGIQVISPGDMASVISWQAISDANWLSVNNEGNTLQYNSPNTDAIFNILFTYDNRVVVPEGRTLEEVITARIQSVNKDSKLMRPENWQEFAVNLRTVARVIDEKLIGDGFLQGIRKEHTSVQNLVLLALAMAYDLNMARANREIHQVLGLKKTFGLSSSLDEAVLGMRLETPDGRRNKAIVGHLNIVNNTESYVGKPYELLFIKKGSVDIRNNVQDMELNGALPAHPSTNPDVVHAIHNVRRAILMGMGSAFDSTLANLLVEGVARALESTISKGMTSVFMPKLTHELQTQGLHLKEVLELMERSIQNAQRNSDFRIENIMTHVFIPQVPDALIEKYLTQLKEAKAAYLNEEGKKLLQDAKTINEVVAIFYNKANWSKDTTEKVAEGWIKEAKLVPGAQFIFDEDDRAFLRSRGITIVEANREEKDKLYIILDNRLNYDTNEVVKLVNRIIEKNDESAAPGNTATTLPQTMVKRIVAIGGQSIRDFYEKLAPYADDPKDSPFSDLGNYDNLWEEARRFKKDGLGDFDDEALTRRKEGIPRIEIRAERGNGQAAQVAIIGVPGIYRAAVTAALEKLAKENGLVVSPSGAMTVEVNQQGVDKALAIGYIERHFEELLDQIGYTPGASIDARKTRSVIITDADGTIYGKPDRSGNPTLDESAARDAVIRYLQAGGLLIINSGNDLEVVVKRLLENNAVPGELRSRVIVVANAGVNMVRLPAEGNAVELPGYRTNALAERAAQSRENDAGSLDCIYIGDDTSEEGSDFPAFVKVGFQRSVTVTKDEFENILPALRLNYIGELEEGTGRLLETVTETAHLKPFQPLFTESGIRDIITRTRIPLTALTPGELLEFMTHFLRHINEREVEGKKSSLAMEPGFITSSTGLEQGEFISVDWGGSNLRVMRIELIPGQAPRLVKSIEMEFTDQHKNGVISPFKAVAQQIAKLNLSPDKEYGLGFTFAQPVEQKNLSSGNLRQWVKGWNIPDIKGKNVTKLLQRALEEEGLGNVKVKALVNDVVATQLAVPNADMGMILGTGFTTSMLDENGQIVNTESGGFIFDGIPQTIYDRNSYHNLDPINEHALEKMVSGAYIGKLLRSHLKALKDQGLFMDGRSLVPFLDEPQQLHKEEFVDENEMRALIDAIRADARSKLHMQMPAFSSPAEAVEWIAGGTVLFRLLDGTIETRLSPTASELYRRIKTKYNVRNLSDLSEQQMSELARNLDGQKMQRIILGLLYADKMPKDSPDVIMTKLVSVVEQYDNLSVLRSALLSKKQFRELGSLPDRDLETLKGTCEILSKRAGRMVAAVIFASTLKMDPDLAGDHIVAVDGSVYEKHPKMRRYIDEGMAELRKAKANDRHGRISFTFIKDASCMGAAIAAANHKGTIEGLASLFNIIAERILGKGMKGHKAYTAFGAPLLETPLFLLATSSNLWWVALGFAAAHKIVE